MFDVRNASAKRSFQSKLLDGGDDFCDVVDIAELEILLGLVKFLLAFKAKQVVENKERQFGILRQIFEYVEVLKACHFVHRPSPWAISIAADSKETCAAGIVRAGAFAAFIHAYFRTVARMERDHARLRA